jgi:hypothetical protein
VTKCRQLAIPLVFFRSSRRPEPSCPSSGTTALTSAY